MDGTRVRTRSGAICYMAFSTAGSPPERWIVVWDEGEEMLAESVLDRWAADPDLSLTEQESWVAKTQLRGESGLTMEEMADWIRGLREQRSEMESNGIGKAVVACIAMAVIASVATAVMVIPFVIVLRLFS